MRTLTETFELHGNDMFVRELTDAETNEVAGGTGTAQIVVAGQSGAGSTLGLTVSAALTTTNTLADATMGVSLAATGANNVAVLAAAATVS